MGTILSFSSRRLHKATPGRAPVTGPAEIVIFSGARIERSPVAPPPAAIAAPVSPAAIAAPVSPAATAEG